MPLTQKQNIEGFLDLEQYLLTCLFIFVNWYLSLNFPLKVASDLPENKGLSKILDKLKKCLESWNKSSLE